VARVLITGQITIANVPRLCCLDVIGLVIASGFAGLLIADVVARLNTFDTHDDISEFSKGCTLKWFSHEIGNHFCSRTPLDTQFTFCNSIGDEEVPDCNMPRVFAARGSSILLKKDNSCCLGTRCSR
jgi:hypothetical protein